MKKEPIIAVLIVLLLAGGAGAGYQFYFKAQIQKFNEDKEYLEQLIAKKNQLVQTFGREKPQDVVAQVASNVQPWQLAVEERARRFSVAQFLKIDPIPDNVLIVKEAYAERAVKIAQDLYRDAYQKNLYIAHLDPYFNQPRPDSVEGGTVNRDQANFWLTFIQFGATSVRLLMESNVLYIEDLQIWPARTTPEGFNTYTIGVAMWMTLEDFCRFLQKLYEDDERFFAVHGFRITNEQLLRYTNPPLRIEMLILIDEYKFEPKPIAPAGTTDALEAMRQLRQQQAPERVAASQPAAQPSFWERIWPF